MSEFIGEFDEENRPQNRVAIPWLTRPGLGLMVLVVGSVDKCGGTRWE